MRVPWTARRSNQSILKEISPECSLEGLMLKLELQYFGYLMQRTDSFEKTLMLGKIDGGRRGRQGKTWLGGIIDSMDMNLSKLWASACLLDPWFLSWRNEQSPCLLKEDGSGPCLTPCKDFANQGSGALKSLLQHHSSKA